VKSEALRNLRTMRQIQTGLDLARRQRLRTTNSLSKTPEEVEHLESLLNSQAERFFEVRERARFSARVAQVETTRQRVLKAREKLAMTINKNRALTELRSELQRTWWEEDPPQSRAPRASDQGRFHETEFRY
jgi:hypothetical protein